MSSAKKTGGKRQAKQISDVLCCRACLATEERLVNMLEHKLVGEFFRVTGIVVSEKDKLPLHLCVWCAALMQRCSEFRAKCLRANDLLLPLKGELTTDSVRAMDRFANRLVGLTQTSIEVDSIDGPAVPRVIEQPAITDEIKKALFMEINSLNENEIKINVVNDDITDSRTNEDDMFDVEYLDAFEDDNYENVNETTSGTISHLNENNVELNIDKSETVNINLNTSMDIKKQINNIHTEDFYNAVRRKKKLRSAENGFLPTVNMEEFKIACNVDIEILTHEEQIAEIEARRATEEFQTSAHPCKPCGRHFQSDDAYRHHQLKHDRKGQHECPVCTIRFNWRGKLWMHLDTHRIKYVCRQCGFVSRTRNQARRHYEFHTGKIYRCNYCGKEYRKQSTYLGHVRQRHKTLNVACDMCGETFINEKGMGMHKAYEHGVLRIRKKYRECKTCSVTFISEEALKKHQGAGVHKDGAHAEVSPCLRCGDNFGSQGALEEHANAEHPSCDVCNSTFLNAESYDVHIARKHLGKGDSKTAKKKAENLRALALDQAPPFRSRYRYPKKPVPKEKYNMCCEHCGKMFANFCNLRDHLRKHTGELPFACDHCPKRFDLKAKLAIHMNVHTWEKPFKCEQCDRQFKMKNNKQRHVRIVHMGIRENSDCNICGRAFTTPYSMKMHVRTYHNGEAWPKRAPRKNKPQIYTMEEIETNSQDEYIEEIVE